MDKIIEINNSIIQHGKSNNRVYIIKADKNNALSLINSVNSLANKNNYTKIFAKIPASLTSTFLKDGYQKEACISGYFNGKEDAVLLGKYFTEAESIITNKEDIKEIISIAKTKKTKKKIKLPSDYKLIKCSKKHAEEMADIYKTVFKTYPFPIHDPNYIKSTMDTHIMYFGTKINDKIVALSSAEIDKNAQSTEMTDFATLPNHLGNNLSLKLLRKMEEEMLNQNIITSYTIARADSFGMNITFAKNNYNFAGTLTNNTNISGNIESMNVWVKSLKQIT